MAHVSVTINGRVYRMACDDGQEQHLARLASEIDGRIAQLRTSFGEIGDTRLAVMAAIMVAEDFDAARRQIRTLEQQIERARDMRLAELDRIQAHERAFATTLEAAAERIEQLARSLDDGLQRGTALG
jgi:cell division protein ZapA